AGFSWRRNYPLAIQLVNRNFTNSGVVRKETAPEFELLVLPVEPSHDLHHARRVGPGQRRHLVVVDGGAGAVEEAVVVVRVRRVGVREAGYRNEIRLVERVQQFEPELEGGTAGDLGPLRDANVGLAEHRSRDDERPNAACA